MIINCHLLLALVSVHDAIATPEVCPEDLYPDCTRLKFSRVPDFRVSTGNILSEDADKLFLSRNTITKVGLKFKHNIIPRPITL